MRASAPLCILWAAWCVHARRAVVTGSGEGFLNTSASTSPGVVVPSSSVSTTSSLDSIASDTGLAYASSCNDAKQSWLFGHSQTLVSSTTLLTSTPTVSETYNVTTITTTSIRPGATPYALCDGYTRIDGTTNTSISVFFTEHTSFRTFTTISAVYSNISAPLCTILSSDCAYLNSSWWSTFNAWTSYDELTLTNSTPVTVTSPPYPSEPTTPICGNVTRAHYTTALGPPACAVNSANVRLLYWPVTTAQDCDLCHLNTCPTTTLGPTISGQPNTYATMNTILTSPTVYIAFDGTWEYFSSGTMFQNQSQLLIPQSSASVSSYCAGPGLVYGQPQSIDYANFNYPVPASAYRCQPKCWTSTGDPYPLYNFTISIEGYTGQYVTQTGLTTTLPSVASLATPSVDQCATIWDDYSPILSIPPEFSALIPAFVVSPDLSCPFLFESGAVLFDPPIALTLGSEIALPTLPKGASIILSTAQPASQPHLTTPQPTTPPQTTTPIPTLPPSATSTSEQTPPPTSTLLSSAPSTIPSSGIILSAPSTTLTALLAPSQSAFVLNSATTLSYNQPTTIPNIGTILANPTALIINTTLTIPISLLPITPTSLPTSPPLILTPSDSPDSPLTFLLLPTQSLILLNAATTLTLGQTTSIPGLGTITAESNGLIVNGVLTRFAAPTPLVLPLPSSTLTADSSSHFLFTLSLSSTQTVLTLVPGAQITLPASHSSGVGSVGAPEIISLDASASAVVIDGSTIPLRSATADPATSRSSTQTSSSAAIGISSTSASASTSSTSLGAKNIDFRKRFALLLVVGWVMAGCFVL